MVEAAVPSIVALFHCTVMTVLVERVFDSLAMHLKKCLQMLNMESLLLESLK